MTAAADLCRDTVRVENNAGELIPHHCLLSAGHDTDPALDPIHRDGQIAWSRHPSGWHSWLDSTPVFA